jgi:hypothetical protein
MSRAEDIKKLIINHNRRLQKLRERQALEGLSIDPKVPIEIEDIETELEALQMELVQLENGSLKAASFVTPHVPQKAPTEALHRTPQIDPNQYTREILYSTLLPVEEMPLFVYGVPCEYKDSQETEAAKHILYPEDDQMCPFIIRGGMLYCFQNLRYEGKGAPFRRLVADPSEVERYDSREWWDDPDKMHWFVSLLNRSLNKLICR